MAESINQFNQDPQTKLIYGVSQLPNVSEKSISAALSKMNEGERNNLSNNFESLKKLPIPAVQKGIEDGSINSNSWQENQNNTADYLNKVSDFGVYAMSPLSNKYSDNLKNDPTQAFPPMVYLKGDIDSFNPKKSVAFIGTREPTGQAKKSGAMLSAQLVDKGYTIVGGLAKGSDTIGHESAVNNGGKTIAWLSNGLDKPIYPKANQGLANQIVSGHGALVSTYPMFENTSNQPKYTFAKRLVERDKFQSASADGVLALQSFDKGGTTHAMQNAIIQNRPVAAPDWSKINLVPKRSDQQTKDCYRVLWVNKQKELDKQYKNAGVSNYFDRRNKVVTDLNGYLEPMKEFVKTELDTPEKKDAFIKKHSDTQVMIDSNLATPLMNKDSFDGFINKMEELHENRSDKTKSQKTALPMTNTQKNPSQWNQTSPNFKPLDALYKSVDLSTPKPTSKANKKIDLKNPENNKVEHDAGDDLLL